MSGHDDLLISRGLLAFQLFDWLSSDGETDRDTLLAMIDVAQQLATDVFLVHNRQIDVDEPRLDAEGVHAHPAIKDALAKYRELGLFGASFPENVGGIGLPFAVSLAIYGNFSAASVATIAYPMLTAANARLLIKFGTSAQAEAFALPQIEGRWFGTMCLSEPQAGSSLGDIRTRAIPDGEDAFGARYLISGNKMWISGGDQDISENIVHLVLAKVAGPDGALPDGAKGTSLFIVPKIMVDGAPNDIAVAGLNHKLGYRGTSNCLMNFGEQKGAVGWRVGQEGQGLAQMFSMMNEARITVGMSAAALGYRSYRHSARYARERLQGRAGDKKTGAMTAIIDHPDVRRMLLQQKVYAEGALALCLYCAHLVDQRDQEADALLALLTPVAKTWPSEFGLVANDLAIQIHGGYGYTRDFDVEQLWRDNRLNPIHEGTTGIQALDLLGRKLIHSDGHSFSLLLNRISSTADRARSNPVWANQADALLAFWDGARDVVSRLRERNSPEAFDDATLFLRAFGHGIVAWLWLDQVLVDGGAATPALREGLVQCCRFFFEAELPQAETWMNIVSGQSDIARSTPEYVF
jgi:alkylation response protein AidB-like acyl-CoA dehydrogenase